MNRSQRMMRLLLATGQRGVCLSEVPSEDRYTARNAVATLRSQGHEIHAEPCKLHGHGSSISRYRLVTVAIEPPPAREVAPPPMSAPEPEPVELFPVFERRGNAR